MKRLVEEPNPNIELRRQELPPTKSLCTAYGLTLFPITGLLGCQHYYLDRPGFGLLYTLTLGFLGVGWLVDILRMPCLVQSINNHILGGQIRKKRVDDAYLLYFPPFGLLGLHHLYLRRWGWFTLYFFTLGLLGIGWIIDSVRLAFLVSKYNKDLEERLLVASVLLGGSGGSHGHGGYNSNGSGQYPHGHGGYNSNGTGQYPHGQGGYNSNGTGQYPYIQPGYYVTTGTTNPPPPLPYTHPVWPGADPTLAQHHPAHPPGLLPPGPRYPAGLGLPPQTAGESNDQLHSWPSIVSSDVGHENTPSFSANDGMPECPPSYQDATHNTPAQNQPHEKT